MREISLVRLGVVRCHYEVFFRNLLTEEKKYGIIATAETT
jgi:hypothetical protein